MTAAASAHPGDWNNSSCHNGRRKVGCQRPGGGQPPASKGRRDFAGVSAKTIAFRSCAEAPAAVASPIRRGPPGMDATWIATATATATPPSRRTSALFISGRHQPTFAPLQLRDRVLRVNGCHRIHGRSAVDLTIRLAESRELSGNGGAHPVSPPTPSSVLTVPIRMGRFRPSPCVG